jgi:hypothetical protein
LPFLYAILYPLLPGFGGRGTKRIFFTAKAAGQALLVSSKLEGLKQL